MRAGYDFPRFVSRNLRAMAQAGYDARKVWYTRYLLRADHVRCDVGLVQSVERRELPAAVGHRGSPFRTPAAPLFVWN